MGWVNKPLQKTVAPEKKLNHPADTFEIDTTGVLPYQFPKEEAFDYPDQSDSSFLFLDKPGNIDTELEYDPVSGEYIFYEKIGNLNYRLPKTMSLQEYVKYDFQNSVRNYWRQRTNQKDLETQGSFVPKLTVGGEAFNRIFGGNTIDVRPQGYVEVSFGYQMNETENPAIPERLRRTPTFDFDQKIQMNVMGNIGEKMKMRVNYNTEATFDYENKMNIEYTGLEDEILKKVEVGNVSLPLQGSLITGGTNLFGLKTEMQFGRLNLTTIISQNRGESRVVETEGGAQKTTFEFEASNYDANRHFFLAQYFRDHYDEALANLPIIQSSISINKIEVWITNKSNNQDEARNILALMDLGEHDPNIFNNVPAFDEVQGNPYPESIFPFNEANRMYDEMRQTYGDIRDIAKVTSTMAGVGFGFEGGQDFEKIEKARKLNPSEYIVHENLGYISLNSSLNADEILAVAFNYTANGQTYQVGEFSTDGIEDPQTLILKLLKGTNLSPKLPTWDLMMKNVYNLNAYQLEKEDFILDVLYLNDSTGTYINYLPESNLEGHILLNVLNVDNLNSQLDPGLDGVFDFIEGVTVHSSTGRIIFPVIEPFGSHLRDSITDPQLAEKYVYQSLYDSTKIFAEEEDQEHNKYRLRGSYKGSSSSEIALGTLNVARGSVRVTAGAQDLIEGIDYTVDYTLGRVKIINPSYLESGTPIKITTDSQDLFSAQRKTMLGAYANYTFSDNFNMGATLLHMNERPLTQKVNYGEDPISNTMVGFDLSYSTQSQLLTTLVDKLPFIETKEPSSISAEFEFAQLFPGHSRVVKSSGTAYIDDFEATKTTLDMKSRSAWVLASTPQKQNFPGGFPEGELNDDLAYGYNRAKLAWYIIDPLFLRNNANTPDHIRNDRNQQSNHLVREVFEREIFPNRETPTGVPTNIPVFDLAFYPEERGPYNYDTQPTIYSDGINPDGTLVSPKKRWGGIMREIQTTDFQAANIEFIEFWMMDPFVNDTLGQNQGGDLYFNLGDISEDVLKDSRKAYENGLPETEQLVDVDTTLWGLVATKQQITNGFITSDAARPNQDVGFDGLTDDNERSFHESYLESLQGILNQDALQKILDDPSGDNYHYYRGSDYDQEQASILERYKDYNGPDGNSVTTNNSPEPFTTSASTLPDMEDINDDNTLSEYERYYQYRVSIRPEDMVLGNNFITDIRKAPVQLVNGQVEEVKWYQFKVPIQQPEQTFGSISDFKSIRFMRMFMKEFADPVVLRFATLDLVRADWRKYNQEVDDALLTPTLETEFDVSAVNIEENGSREPVNYVLPPDIDRVIDPANPQLRQLNEQSLVLRTINLEKGDARAAYKNIYMDFRQYRRLRMEVHAEEIEDESPTNDGDLHFFVRIGSDFKFNYYEYELPLKLTEPGLYNGDFVQDRLEVWPDDNRINIPLSVFTDVKQARNAALRQAGSTTRINEVFPVTVTDENGFDRVVKIKGNPNLGNVEGMMVGIRYNSVEGSTPGKKSVEVWLNELRLTDFEEDGGWAANARITAQLADLGSISMAGRTRSAGFGSIDQKVNQRAMDDLVEYDISSNLELGKFFNEKANVRIPMYVGISKSISNPKYNPLDPDILMEDALNNAASGAEKDSIKKMSQDYVSRKSINFTNVKVDKMNKSGKPRFYDPTNFSLTYSYNELNQRDINTETNLEKNYRGMFSYNFNNRPTLVEPFKKSKLLKGKVFKLVKDFNFYPMPTQISYRTDLYRHYKEVQLRNITNPNMIIPRTVEKDFVWNRYFDLRYNLTRSLKIDFSSQGTARIDEPAGRINRNDDDYTMKRDSIIENLLNLGRPVMYHHVFNASYQVPINKIPILNWMSLSGRYQAQYDWHAGPITDETIELGNVAENSRVAQLNGQVSMLNLYNKVPFLKEVNQKFGGRSSRSARSSRSRARTTQQTQKKNQPKFKNVKYEADNMQFKANVPRTINHKLKTDQVQLFVRNSTGKSIKGETKIINDNRITFTSSEDIKGASILITGKREEKDDLAKKIAQYTARTLMSVKNISFSYSTSDGTVLPGFMPEPSLFGSGNYDPDPNRFGQVASSTAPGLPFLFGWQDDNFARKAAEKGWITNDTTLNQPYLMNHNETFSIRASVEPIPFLRIDLNANRSYSENVSEFLNYNTETGSFESQNSTLRGNFTMSINTWSTAFSKMGAAEVEPSDAFQTMKDNRVIISRRLANRRGSNTTAGYDHTASHPDGGNYRSGYGPNSQEVLIPAFIAAYTGQSAEKVSLNPFPSFRYMRPNWRITYDGIVSNIKGLNKYVKSLNFNHSYRSSYNVGSFISNLNYDDSEYGDGFSYVQNELNGDFLSRFDINSVSINEQFAPLINMDVTWLNDLTTRAELKRSRSLTLNFANNQLTEVLSNEVIFGVGYRFNRMDLIIKTRNSQKAYSNDLNVRADVSFRKNKTLLRRLDEPGQITAGQNAITIKTTADYMLSDRFQLRVYYDRVVNKPFTSIAFPTSNTNFGMSFRFTLAQ